MAPPVVYTCLLACLLAATYGWGRIGEIIPTTEDADASVASAEQKGETDNCLTATSTPTKWILVAHSMGTMAVEAVSGFSKLLPLSLFFWVSPHLRHNASPRDEEKTCA